MIGDPKRPREFIENWSVLQSPIAPSAIERFIQIFMLKSVSRSPSLAHIRVNVQKESEIVKNWKIDEIGPEKTKSDSFEISTHPYLAPMPESSPSTSLEISISVRRYFETLR